MNSKQNQLQAFERLLNIMDDLREKCPWDKKQTMQTLRHLTIEETYELGDAILDNDLNEVKKELGDLLLHIVFYAKIGSETKLGKTEIEGRKNIRLGRGPKKLAGIGKSQQDPGQSERSGF